MYYNSNWKSLSSKETAFSMKLMEQFDAQILIGQLSFKQCADLIIYTHVKNQCQSTEISESSEIKNHPDYSTSDDDISDIDTTAL